MAEQATDGAQDWTGRPCSEVPERVLRDRADTFREQAGTVDAGEWFRQNFCASWDMTADDRAVVEDYAQDYSGNLRVLIRELDGAPDGWARYVKMHDSWGGPENGLDVVVHTYDTEAPGVGAGWEDHPYPDGEPFDRVEWFASGHAALARFLQV